MVREGASRALVQEQVEAFNSIILIGNWGIAKWRLRVPNRLL